MPLSSDAGSTPSPSVDKSGSVVQSASTGGALSPTAQAAGNATITQIVAAGDLHVTLSKDIIFPPKEQPILRVSPTSVFFQLTQAVMKTVEVKNVSADTLYAVSIKIYRSDGGELPAHALRFFPDKGDLKSEHVSDSLPFSSERIWFHGTDSKGKQCYFLHYQKLSAGESIYIKFALGESIKDDCHLALEHFGYSQIPLDALPPSPGKGLSPSIRFPESMAIDSIGVLRMEEKELPSQRIERIKHAGELLYNATASRLNSDAIFKERVLKDYPLGRILIFYDFRGAISSAMITPISEFRFAENEVKVASPYHAPYELRLPPVTRRDMPFVPEGIRLSGEMAKGFFSETAIQNIRIASEVLEYNDNQIAFLVGFSPASEELTGYVGSVRKLWEEGIIQFSKRFKSGSFNEIWDEADQILRSISTKADFMEYMNSAFNQLGPLKLVTPLDFIWWSRNREYGDLYVLLNGGFEKGERRFMLRFKMKEAATLMLIDFEGIVRGSRDSVPTKGGPPQ